MGLFKKENCCICGNKTGLLDKKCIDGKICKDCREKLSVWFDDYKGSTADDIKNQLEQKRNDEEKAAELNFNRIYGEFGVILIDEKDRVFTAFPSTSKGLFGNNKKVTSIQDVMEFHPDLISFDRVKDIEIDIRQMTHEDTREEDGRQVSYYPPHYEYDFIFTLRFIIDHPYIKTINIKLNRNAVSIENIGERAWTDPGRKLAAHLLGLPNLIVEDREAVYDNESFIANFFRSEYEMPAMSYGFKCTNKNWKDVRKYHYYLTLSREIRDIIMSAPKATTNKWKLQPVYPELVEKIEAKYRAKIDATSDEMIKKAYQTECDVAVAEEIARQRKEAIEQGGELGERIKAENEALQKELEASLAKMDQGDLAKAMEEARKFQEEAEQIMAGPSFCPNCGAPVAGKKFCSNCGEKIV